MAVQTAGSFIETLEKSQLLEPSQIKEACDSATNSEDPASIARYLLRKEWVTKWQAALLLKGRHRYKIGKYTIVDQIGAGTSLGQVYVAEHEQMGRRAVVKVLSQTHLKNEELVRRFLEEARKVAALDHRNLAHVFDIGEDGDRYFVVMEHVKGHDLAKLVEMHGPFAPAKAVACATQALRGLAHAHEHEVVNGAIEPKNLLLDDNGDLKVLDTGEARLADALKQTLNKKFASPEQLAGNEPSAASDVFAVGRVLTFLVGGASNLTGDLRKIVARMTAEKPDDRFGDAGKVAELLENWAGQQASEEPKGEAKAPTAKPPAAKAPPAKAPAAKARATKSGKKSPTSGAQKASSSKDTDSKGAANLEETTEFAVANKKRKKKPVFRTDDSASEAEAPAENSKPVAKAAPAKAKPAPKKKKTAAAAALVADDPFAIDGNESMAAPGEDPLGDPLAMDPAMMEAAEPLETLPVPEEEPAAVEPAESKGLPVVLLAAVGGGVALVLLLLVSAVAAGIYMVSLAPTEVAVNADATVDPPEVAGDGSAGEDGEELPEETNVFGNPGGNPPPPVDGAEDGEPAADGGEQPANPPATPDGDNPKDPKATDSDPENPEPTKPEPKKPEPKKPEPKKPEPKKPEPKKPEPKKPEPKKPVNPFAGIKGEIELKKLEDTSPLVLGKVTLNPRERPLVDLEGGENANPGTQKFKLEEVLGTSERRYEFFLLNSRVLESEAKIAEMFINDKNQVVLQWTTDAAADPVAAYLRNCSISFTSGRGGHVVSLRKQAVTEPIVLDMEAKSSPKATVSIPNPPDKSALYVEFELLGKDLPPAQFAGKGNKVGVAPEIEANGGLLYIAFGNPNLLTLRVTSKMSGDSVNITVTPSLGGALNPSGKPQRVVMKDAEAALARGRAAYTAFSAQEKAANDYAKKNANNKQLGKQVAAAKQAATLAHGKLVAVEAQNKNLQQLIELVKKLNNKKLAFRVFLDADGAKNYMSKDQ